MNHIKYCSDQEADCSQISKCDMCKKAFEAGMNAKIKSDKPNFWKRLFCSHIYKTIDKSLIRTDEEAGYIGPIYYNVHSVTEKCVKCGHVKIWEDRKPKW